MRRAILLASFLLFRFVLLEHQLNIVERLANLLRESIRTRLFTARLTRDVEEHQIFTGDDV